ncbi:hypothetical protein LTR36_006841 [Oleoguttula mirabilis]|uniref:F-box domain-containing protein n=1 Tax=Oleoguttula mirabilis TaxID=1507867 RepID=A0AAV9JB56_9PEZI|nr:hypothetical protein LTR36_006841 [Oleoguttula mirabilis]
MENSMLDKGPHASETQSDVKLSEANPPPKQGESERTTETATGSFRFLELPAEIRNMIYSLLLEAQKPIEMQRIISGVSRSFITRPPTYNTSVEHYRTHLHVGILQTNQQIHAEATPILYSLNTLNFGLSYSEARNLHAFLQHIGSSRQHVRHLALCRIRSNTELRAALHLLKEARALETVKLGCYLPEHFDTNSSRKRSRYFNPQKNIQVLLPCLKSLQNARKASGKDGCAVEVFRLQDIPRRDYRYEGEDKYQEVRGRMRRAFENLKEELKQALA